jgi:hypothetical protein
MTDNGTILYNSSLKYKIPMFSQMLLPDLMKISRAGATTLSITTFSITTLSIMTLS